MNAENSHRERRAPKGYEHSPVADRILYTPPGDTFDIRQKKKDQPADADSVVNNEYNISLAQVLEQLENSGIIQKNEDGSWTKTGHRFEGKAPVDEIIQNIFSEWKTGVQKGDKLHVMGEILEISRRKNEQDIISDETAVSIAKYLSGIIEQRENFGIFQEHSPYGEHSHNFHWQVSELIQKRFKISEEEEKRVGHILYDVLGKLADVLDGLKYEDQVFEGEFLPHPKIKEDSKEKKNSWQALLNITKKISGRKLYNQNEISQRLKDNEYWFIAQKIRETHKNSSHSEIQARVFEKWKEEDKNRVGTEKILASSQDSEYKKKEEALYAKWAREGRGQVIQDDDTRIIEKILSNGAE